MYINTSTNKYINYKYINYKQKLWTIYVKYPFVDNLIRPKSYNQNYAAYKSKRANSVAVL